MIIGLAARHWWCAGLDAKCPAQCDAGPRHAEYLSARCWRRVSQTRPALPAAWYKCRESNVGFESRCLAGEMSGTAEDAQLDAASIRPVVVASSIYAV